MNFPAQVVNWTIKNLTSIVCRIDEEKFAQIPERGPLILVANHINFLEVPIIYPRLMPRPVTAYAKAETWDNPALGTLFNLWGIIPIRRGEPDLSALRLGLAALKTDHILAVIPEGTRSRDGHLQRGHAGVVFLALQSGAPILPIAFHGNEKYRDNLRNLRRTEFHMEVGYPFYLDPGDAKMTQHLRQIMVDEIMYQLSALLPEEYRGVYTNLGDATENYLRFPASSKSNLLFA